MNADGIGSPANAPGQKERILEWLITEPGGLTQLQALQHLAVARLAAMVWRLKHDDGHNIRTELTEVPTRYGPAVVARYHLVHLAPLDTFTLPERAREASSVVGFLHPVDIARMAHKRPEQPQLFEAEDQAA